MPKRPEYAKDAPMAQRFRERLAEEQRRQGVSDAGLAKRVSDLGLRMTAATVWKIKSGEPPRKVDLDEAHALASALGYESASALVGDDTGKRCRDLAAAVEGDMDSIRRTLRETDRALREFGGLAGRLSPVDRVRLSAEIADSMTRASQVLAGFTDRNLHGLVDDDVQRAVEGMERERRAEAERRRKQAERQEAELDALVASGEWEPDFQEPWK